MNRKRIMQFLLGVAAVVLLAPLASADTLSVTLMMQDITVVQGTTLVQFFGTITNPITATDTIYLNSDQASIFSPLMNVTVDDSPFAYNAPTYLAPGYTSGLIELFDVNLPADLGTGNYSGVFTILGGADGGAYTAFDDLVDVNYSVTVNAPTTATPEPGSLLFLAFGLAGLAALGKTKKLAAT